MIRVGNFISLEAIILHNKMFQWHKMFQWQLILDNGRKFKIYFSNDALRFTISRILESNSPCYFRVQKEGIKLMLLSGSSYFQGDHYFWNSMVNYLTSSTHTAHCLQFVDFSVHFQLRMWIQNWWHNQESRTGGSLARFTNGKNRGSRLWKFVFLNNKNKLVRDSF